MWLWGWDGVPSGPKCMIYGPLEWDRLEEEMGKDIVKGYRNMILSIKNCVTEYVAE